MMMNGVKNLNSLIVGAYKLFGFGLLIAIVGGMFFYLSTTLFFFLNERWVVPAILSSDHTRVADAKIGYLQQLYQYQKLDAERVGIEKEIEYINYASGLHDNFRNNYVQAIETELENKKQFLNDIESVASQYRSLAKSSGDRRSAYGKITTKTLDTQFASRLIDKSQFLSGQYMLSQIDLSNLTHKERIVELERQEKSLKTSISAIESVKEAIKHNQMPQRKSVDVDMLLKEHQLIQSFVSHAELQSRLAPLEIRIKSLDQLLSQFLSTLDSLEKSPYVRASQEAVTVAFVPYENLPNVKTATPVFGCYLEFFLCRKVGSVRAVLPGETSLSHPLNGGDLRGQMIELEMTEKSWSESRALMVGRAPLFL